MEFTVGVKSQKSQGLKCGWGRGWEGIICLRCQLESLFTESLCGNTPVMLEFCEAVLNPPFLFPFCFLVLLFPTFWPHGRFLVSEIACRVGNLKVSIVQPSAVVKTPFGPFSRGLLKRKLLTRECSYWSVCVQWALRTGLSKEGYLCCFGSEKSIFLVRYSKIMYRMLVCVCSAQTFSLFILPQSA